MSDMLHQTPVGVSEYLPKDAAHLDSQHRVLQDCFAKAGYLPIKTPTIEYSESLEPGLGDHLKEHCIEFFDPKGKRLMLRPDNTTPIIRTVASRMQSHPLPLRLSYTSPIFRKSLLDRDSDTELLQAGCEMVGYQSITDVASVILLCINALSALGVTNIGIDIGHVDFVKGLSDTQKHALLEGDYITYGGIPDRGGKEVIQGHHECEQVWDALVAGGLNNTLFMNKGLVKELHYYTGIIFEVYAQDMREVIASGGQYDQLCGKFGYDQPAVGFALHLNHLNGEI